MRRIHCIFIVLAGLLSATLGRAATLASTGDIQSEKLFRSVEAFWSQEVASLGGRYRPPKLIFFARSLKNLCDVPAALRGPFYCPVSETVYLDRTFMQQLMQRSEDNADDALGYVVAHEVAHHVQNVLGTTTLVDQARSRSTAELAQRTLTTFELQADCYAGLWVRWAQASGTIKIPADVSATLDTVAGVSQDWQSHLGAGQEMLDPLTHGSAAQRLKWFRRGLESGGFNDCDTFGAEAAGNL